MIDLMDLEEEQWYNSLLKSHPDSSFSFILPPIIIHFLYLFRLSFLYFLFSLLSFLLFFLSSMYIFSFYFILFFMGFNARYCFVTRQKTENILFPGGKKFTEKKTHIRDN